MRDYESIQLIGSLAKGLTILELLLEKGPLGATEVSKYLDVNKSSAFRLLVTLESKGFVEQNASTGKYHLGLKLAKFKTKSLNNYELHERAKPFLDELCAQTNETCGLCVLINNEPVIIDKRNSPYVISTNLKIGDVLPFHSTAMGRALICNLSEEEILRLLPMNLEAYTPNTVTDITKLCQRLKQEAQETSVVEYEEYTLGMRCIAGKVFDYNDKVTATMGISAPIERLPDSKIPLVREIVEKQCLAFSRTLGY